MSDCAELGKITLFHHHQPSYVSQQKLAYLRSKQSYHGWYGWVLAEPHRWGTDRMTYWHHGLAVSHLNRVRAVIMSLLKDAWSRHHGCKCSNLDWAQEAVWAPVKYFTETHLTGPMSGIAGPRSCTTLKLWWTTTNKDDSKKYLTRWWDYFKKGFVSEASGACWNTWSVAGRYAP